jgi:hypothetical protein
MNLITTAATPAHPFGRGRLATGIIAAAAGALVGVCATTTIIDRNSAGVQHVAPVPPAVALLPGSADAFEQRIAVSPPRQAAMPADPLDPAQWGPPGHVTMSADAIAQQVGHRAEASTSSPPRTADAAEQWIPTALPEETRGPADPSDPAQWGSPGHVTMSADAIEH